MTEKIQINGEDMWIVIEPHITHMSDVQSKEYFTAFYHGVDPAIDPDGSPFLDMDHKPVVFGSVAEAIKYAEENLKGAY